MQVVRCGLLVGGSTKKSEGTNRLAALVLVVVAVVDVGDVELHVLALME